MFDIPPSFLSKLRCSLLIWRNFNKLYPRKKTLLFIRVFAFSNVLVGLKVSMQINGDFLIQGMTGKVANLKCYLSPFIAPRF